MKNPIQFRAHDFIMPKQRLCCDTNTCLCQRELLCMCSLACVVGMTQIMIETFNVPAMYSECAELRSNRADHIAETKGPRDGHAGYHEKSFSSKGKTESLQHGV